LTKAHRLGDVHAKFFINFFLHLEKKIMEGVYAPGSRIEFLHTRISFLLAAVFDFRKNIPAMIFYNQ
jgi:hypothetical protein